MATDSLWISVISAGSVMTGSVVTELFHRWQKRTDRKDLIEDEQRAIERATRERLYRFSTQLLLISAEMCQQSTKEGILDKIREYRDLIRNNPEVLVSLSLRRQFLAMGESELAILAADDSWKEELDKFSQFFTSVDFGADEILKGTSASQAKTH